MKALAALTLTALLVAAGCGGSSRDAAAPPPKQGLTDLRSVEHLRTLFDAHSGEPRLILLMSPT
jgi:hypothetical protein